MKRGPKPTNMIGQRYGRLVAISYISDGKWLFDCDCGAIKIAWGTDVRRGKVRSCGCLLEEIKKTGDLRRVHGASGTPEMNTFTAMHARCRDAWRIGYEHYGGRGIKVCDRWQNFENFLADMGPRPVGHSLDRIDPDGDYEPGNCRWADATTQACNRRGIFLLEVNGISKPIGTWARETGLSTGTIKYRLKIGMTPEQAVLTPSGYGRDVKKRAIQ